MHSYINGLWWCPSVYEQRWWEHLRWVHTVCTGYKIDSVYIKYYPVYHKYCFWNIAGDCGGIFIHRNSYLTSPAYQNLVSNHESCIYKVSQPNDTYIKLKILQFNLTFDTTCNDDYVEIRDGITAESPLIGKFCGTDIPSTIVSSQNNIWLR